MVKNIYSSKCLIRLMISIAIIKTYVYCKYTSHVWEIINDNLVQIQCMCSRVSRYRGFWKGIGWGPPQKAWCHAKESGLNLINQGEPRIVIIFNQKTSIWYRNLQDRRMIGVFCTFIGHVEGDILCHPWKLSRGSSGRSLPEVQAIRGWVFWIKLKKKSLDCFLLSLCPHNCEKCQW